jgi:hypothetical protein
LMDAKECYLYFILLNFIVGIFIYVH